MRAKSFILFLNFLETLSSLMVFLSQGSLKKGKDMKQNRVGLMVRAVLAIFIVSQFGAEAYARKRVNRIRGAQSKQQSRINQGLYTGSLTDKEAKGLKRGQKRVRSLKQEARVGDGKIDKSEAKRIRKAQRRQSRRIKRKKHN
jgi:hypothetical protein